MPTSVIIIIFTCYTILLAFDQILIQNVYTNLFNVIDNNIFLVPFIFALFIGIVFSYTHGKQIYSKYKLVNNIFDDNKIIDVFIYTLITFIFFDLLLNFIFRKNFLGTELIKEDMFNMNMAAQWGDSLSGHFTAIAAILAFAIYRSQKKELQETRNKLEDQNFDNTFFNMLDFYTRIKNELQVYSQENSKIVNGELALQEYYKKLLEQIEENSKKEQNFDNVFEKVYQKFLDENAHQLAHYFRTVYRIFKFLDDELTDSISTKDKYREMLEKHYNYHSDQAKREYTSPTKNFNKKLDKYLGITVAQLSKTELHLIMINGLTKYGKKFYFLIQEHSILKNMIVIKKDSEVLKPLFLKYHIRAWKKNDYFLRTFYQLDEEQIKYIYSKYSQEDQ